MPTYGYRCEKNGHEFEVVQSIWAEPLKRCEVCGSKVNRIFYPVGIVFKGSGFYATDNRGGPSLQGSGEKSESESKSEASEVKAAKADAGPEKSDSKTDSKSKPKTDSKSKSASAAKKS